VDVRFGAQLMALMVPCLDNLFEADRLPIQLLGDRSAEEAPLVVGLDPRFVSPAALSENV
jgi:hypothetical protein